MSVSFAVFSFFTFSSRFSFASKLEKQNEKDILLCKNRAIINFYLDSWTNHSKVLSNQYCSWRIAKSTLWKNIKSTGDHIELNDGNEIEKNANIQQT